MKMACSELIAVEAPSKTNLLQILHACKFCGVKCKTRLAIDKFRTALDKAVVSIVRYCIG